MLILLLRDSSIVQPSILLPSWPYALTLLPLIARENLQKKNIAMSAKENLH